MMTAITVTLGTGAFAGNSDRHNDLRFDSAVGHVGQTLKVVTAEPRTKATLSSKGKMKPRYADANPYGVGPHNDSR